MMKTKNNERLSKKRVGLFVLAKSLEICTALFVLFDPLFYGIFLFLFVSSQPIPDFFVAFTEWQLLYIINCFMLLIRFL